MRQAAHDFATDGVSIGDAVVSTSTVSRLRDLPEFRHRNRPGARAVSISPAVAALVGPDGVLTDVAGQLMGERVRSVRVLYFDKTPDMNWAVPWHQDRTIAVVRRAEVPGFKAWNVKAGVHHVEPPESILQSMVSVRLHLDDCGHDNGPLLALRGSFRLGRVAANHIKGHVESGSVAICCAKAGDVAAMRGLTIHASDRALRPEHRRVLHVDFSATELPGGLQWALA